MYSLELVGTVPRGASSYYTLCVRQPYVVGRLENCDIRLQSQDVSRAHATLQVVLSSSVSYSYVRGEAKAATADASPPLSLVMKNRSKFGVAVDGMVINGSCVVPHGSIVCFGSVGMRAVYRPILVSINPFCYAPEHVEELASLLCRLGATVVDTPVVEEEVSTFPPIAKLFVSELIDGSVATATALLRGYSIVLPSYPFEMLSSLADQCHTPLHRLPKPADFEPPKSTALYAGVSYLRPESRTVPFSLYGARLSIPGRDERSRSALFSDCVFTFCDATLLEEIATIVSAAGGTLLDWKNAMNLIVQQGGNRDDTDPGDGGLKAAAEPPSDTSTTTANAVVSQQHERASERRYAVATERELAIIRGGFDDAPTPDAPIGGEEWRALAKNGWEIIKRYDILRALLGNKFDPLPEISTEMARPLAAPELLYPLEESSEPQQANADVDSDATPSDPGEALTPTRRLVFQHDDVARLAEQKAKSVVPMRTRSPADRVAAWVARQRGGSKVSRTAMAFDLRLHNTQIVIDRTIQACRQRVVEIDRSIDTLRSRPPPTEATCAALSGGGQSPIPPAAHPSSVEFLRRVVERCGQLLSQLEAMSQEPESAPSINVIEAQWDTCESVRLLAQSTLERLTEPHHAAAVTSHDDEHTAQRPSTRRSRSSTPNRRLRRAAGAGIFRGSIQPGEEHFMRPFSSTNSVTSDARGRASSVGATSRQSVAATGSRRGASQRPLNAMSSEADRFVMRRTADASFRERQGISTSPPPPQTPSRSRNATGLRDRTRWARYMPPPPLTALSSRAKTSAEGHKLHQALYISSIPPTNLSQISAHQRLFIQRFGIEEGGTRFSMWLSSQTPQWTSAFVESLEAQHLTLGAFLRRGSSAS